MITTESVLKIGKLQKSHGIKGEISILYDKPEYADIDTDFYFMDIDSIFVPFLIEEVSFSSDTRGRVKFEYIDDEIEASKYANIDLYILRSEMPKSENGGLEDSWFIGYQIIDQHDNKLGIIKDIDDSTMNILFIVENNEGEFFIPATEDFISEIDDENRILYLILPEGLIE